MHLNGSTYEGNWTNNFQNGYGIETFPDGSIYKGNSSGKMVHHMKVNLIMICLMAKGYIFFQMVKNIMVIGKIIKWTEKENLLGLMEEYM